MTPERMAQIEERLRWRAVDWRDHLGCDGGIYDREAFFEGAVEDLLAELDRRAQRDAEWEDKIDRAIYRALGNTPHHITDNAATFKTSGGMTGGGGEDEQIHAGASLWVPGERRHPAPVPRGAAVVEGDRRAGPT